MKKTFIIYVLSLIFIPVLIISYFYNSLIKYELTNTKTSEENNSKKYIRVQKDNKIQTIELEKYIIGVVAGEMPASFNIEALKAQAIASRT